MIRYTHFFFFFACFAVLSCQVPQKLQDVTTPQPPAFFSQSYDSLSQELSLKKLLFQDSFLRSLQEEAIRQNADFLIAQQRIIQANAEVNRVRGLRKPFISAGTLPAIRRYGLYTMDGAGNATTDILENKRVPVHLTDFLIGFQSSWELDFFNKLKSAKQAAQSRLWSSQEGKNWVKSNLIAEISALYIELLTNDQLKEEVAFQKALQQSALNAVRLKWEAGQETALAIQQMEALLLNMEATALELEQAENLLEQEINILLGRFPQPIKRGKLMDLERSTSALSLGVPSDLLVHRPDLRALEAELHAAKADVTVARAAFLPSVQLTTSLGVQAFNPQLLVDPQSLAYTLVGNLLGPLVNRSQLQSNYQQQRSTLEETLIRYQQAVVASVVEVEYLLEQRDSWLAIAGLKKQEADVLDQAVNTADQLFQKGRSGYLETLTAQQAALQARMEWTRARGEVLRVQVDLYKALGGGWQ